MKQFSLIALIVALAVATTGVVFAQAGGGKGPGASGGPGQDQQKGQSLKIEGKLVIADSQIAIQTKDATYTVRGFEYLIGFVDGLQEGAMVRVEGELLSMGGKAQILRATRLNFKGRDFDLTKNSPMGGMGGGQGGPGMGGQDRSGPDGR